MKDLQIATFGGGCFWCVEAVIQRLEGVESVVSGYAGGHTENPKYREICSGTSGHAEVVQVRFDPSVMSYEDLLSIFMTTHDPTTLNQQGADRGTQYRSVIMYHDEEQKEISYKVLTDLAPSFPSPIVTEVVPLPEFFQAEKYHQNYFNRNGYAGYCRVVIDPKVKILRERYASRLKKDNSGAI